MGLIEWLSICSDVERHVIGRYARDLMDNNCVGSDNDQNKAL
jgi:hypothetical protein